MYILLTYLFYLHTRISEISRNILLYKILDFAVSAMLKNTQNSESWRTIASTVPVWK